MTGQDTTRHRSLPSASEIRSCVWNSTARLWVGVDFRNLGPLYADPGHQPFLVEDKSIDAFLQGGGGKVFAKPSVQNDQGRPGTDFPTVGAVKISERRVIHEE